MRKRKSNLDDLYLINKKPQGEKFPRLMNDLAGAAQKSALTSFDLPLARYVLRTKKDSILLPSGKRARMKNFLPTQTGRYLTFSAQAANRRVDGLFFNPQSQKNSYGYSSSLVRGDLLLEELKEKYSSLKGYFSDLSRGSFPSISLARAWNVSIVGAVIFGMVTMTFIYRYLGESVSAKIDEGKQNSSIQQEVRKSQVLGAEDYAEDEADVEFITKLLEVYEKNDKKDALEKEIREMVKGYPIEEMIPEIVKKDRIVAAFLVSIAKKESNWGKRVPVLDGQDCYNYWGYRGIRKRMGTGGHTCFDSQKDAVDTVAKRMTTLIDEYGKNNPAKMVIWKCGSDCNATGGQAAANKWISDVNLYFKKLNK